MNSFSALADPNEPVDPVDVEFFKFSSLVPDVKVAVQNEAFDIAKYPATASLIACASKLGNLAVVTVDGFIFSKTKALRQTVYEAEKGTTVPFQQEKISILVSKPIHQLRFTATEEQIVLAVEGGELSVYNVKDIETQKENAKPVNSFTLPQEIVDLRPNPEEFPNLAAVLLNNNRCQIVDITNGSTTCELSVDDATAICWSPKGKQIVCGRLDGSLQHFDINGASKDVLPIPQQMSAEHDGQNENRRVQDVLWVENHIFLVFYGRKPENDDDPLVNDGYIIDRKPKTGTEPLYTRLSEVTPIFTTEGRGNHFYMEVIRGLGKEIKHLVVIANAATSEISVVGENEQGEWATWTLPENGLANFPLSEETYVDTYPLGLCLDFSANEKLPPVEASDSEKEVEPVPVMYYINDEGHVGAYHCYNIELARRGESYKTSEAKHTTTPTAAVSTPAANPPSGFSAFGSGTTSESSFADLLSGKTTSQAPAETSGFGGFGGFGSSSSIPSFSNLGSAAKISTPSGFGFSNSTIKPAAPAFGSTSGFGSGNGFGNTNTAAEKPFTGFSTTSTTTTTATATATSTAPAATPVSAFGATSTIGNGPAKTTATAAPTTTAFGTKPEATGSFASFAKNTVPGATAPKSTFGTTATTGFGSGGFGSVNTQTTDDKTAAKPTTPMFGSTTSLGGGNFASFAKNTVPGATAPKTTFGSSGGFGSSGFTSQPTESKPTTTATSISPPAATKSETKPATTPTFGSTASLGGGSFASFAKNTVPGATIPKSTFGSSGGFGSSTTTPTSPPVKLADSSTPAVAPKAITPSSTTPKITTSEKAKPTAEEEGMAKQFEATYFSVTEDIEKLKEYYNKISIVMKMNTMEAETKTEESLKDVDLKWGLNETAQLGALASSLNSKNEQDSESVKRTKANVNVLIDNCKKLMDKQGDIEYLLGKEVDSSVVDILDNRELDAETKSFFDALQNKVEATDNIIQDLELKIQVNNNRNKIKNEHEAGTLSLYSLHRAIRDIEREVVFKNKDIKELEERLSGVKLNSDEEVKNREVSFEEEDDMIDQEIIERTTRYIRRYNFLDVVINETSKRAPLEA